MTRHRTHEQPASEGHAHRTQAHASEKGHAPTGENGAGTEQTSSPTAADRMQRAEEMVDRIGEQVGQYVSVLGHQLLRLAARAREEAEDIWEEAQSIRRGRKP